MKTKSICCFIILFFCASLACSSDHSQKERAKQLLIQNHLALLDDWAIGGGTKEEIAELANPCGILVRALAVDTASTVGNELLDRLYFCQDATLSRVKTSHKEIERLENLCATKLDLFYQTICESSNLLP